MKNKLIFLSILAFLFSHPDVLSQDLEELLELDGHPYNDTPKKLTSSKSYTLITCNVQEKFGVPQITDTVQSIIVSQNGSMISIAKFQNNKRNSEIYLKQTYYPSGQLNKRELTTKKGNIIRISKYEERKSKDIKEINYNGDGKIDLARFIYLNESDKISIIRFKVFDENREIKFIYDDKGRLTKITNIGTYYAEDNKEIGFSYNDKDEIDYFEEKKYDIKSNKMITDRKISITYEYDSKGNWITKKFFKWEEGIKIQVAESIRKIAYK